jgi:hypothetical protein
MPIQTSANSRTHVSSKERETRYHKAIKTGNKMRIRISHALALFIVGTWGVLSFLSQEEVRSEVIVVCIILVFALLVELQNFDATKK